MYKQLNIIFILTATGFGWLFFSSMGGDSNAKEKLEDFAITRIIDDIEMEIEAFERKIRNNDYHRKPHFDSTFYQTLDSLSQHLDSSKSLLATDTTHWILDSIQSQILSLCNDSLRVPEEWLAIIKTEETGQQWQRLKTRLYTAIYLKSISEQIPPEKSLSQIDLLAHFELNDSANFIIVSAVNRRLQIETEQSTFNGKTVNISGDKVYQYPIDSLLGQPNELKVHVKNQKTGQVKIYSSKLEFEVK